MISASASGKLFLFGEHAVVYGYPAIVLSLDKKITVNVERTLGDRDLIFVSKDTNDRLIKKSLEIFREEATKALGGGSNLKIISKADFSDKLGLGSSSAVVVATIKALSKLYDMNLSNKEIFDLSYRVILSVQPGNSGADIAAAIYGGIIYYQKPGKINLMSGVSLPLIIAYSGEKAQSGKQIEKVRRLYLSKTKETRQIFEDIALIVNEAEKSIKDKDFVYLGKLMMKNHKLLKQLNISTKKLDSLVDVAAAAGAYGAKLSGAGGGDCIIALAAENKRQQVCQKINEVGGIIL